MLQCTLHPLILCRCCVQDPNDLDIPLQMEEGERSALPSPPSPSTQGCFLQESEGKEEGFGLYIYPVSKVAPH